jgi:hypothetical protein
MIKEEIKTWLLAALAVIFMALGTALPAKAVTYPYPAVTQYRAEYNYTPTFRGPYQNTVQAACEDFLRLWMSTVAPGQTWTLSYCDASSKSFKIAQKNNSNNTYIGSVWEYLRCPNGGIRSGSVCNADPNAPPAGPVCTAGSTVRVTYKMIDSKGVTLPKPPLDGSTDGECKLKLVDVKSCYLGVDDVSYCTYIGERSGDPLAASDKVPGPSTEVAAKPGEEPLPTNAGSVKDGTACPKGTVAGGFSADGLINCVGTGSTPKNPSANPKTTQVATSTTNPDGSVTVTTTTIKVNADGSNTTTVDKVTTASPSNGGGVTKEQTKETTPTAGGAPGKETPDKPQEQVNFCKQNPNLAVCRESSVSGTCGQTACVGDAIQCATLRSAAAMECRERDAVEELKRMPVRGSGQAIMDGADPQQGAIDAMLKGEVIDLSRPNLDESGFLGGGSCFAPKNFMVAGRSVTVEFGIICDNIQPLRYVVLACAFIVAYLLVSKSVMDAA